MALPVCTNAFSGHDPPLKMQDKIWLAPSSSSGQLNACLGKVLPKNPKKKKEEGRF
jgi:hypothetical protein